MTKQRKPLAIVLTTPTPPDIISKLKAAGHTVLYTSDPFTVLPVVVLGRNCWRWNPAFAPDAQISLMLRGMQREAYPEEPRVSKRKQVKRGRKHGGST